MSQSNTSSSAQRQNIENIEYADLGFDSKETTYPLSKDENLASLIGAFQMTFNDSVYQENWDYEFTKDIIAGLQDEDYEGILALNEGTVVGFAWGYVPESEEMRTDNDFPDELQEVDTSFLDGETYWFNELGVVEDWRNQGLGKRLKEKELDRIAERQDISRGLERTNFEDENEKKLGLDSDLGFEPVNYEGEPLVKEIEQIGVEDEEGNPMTDPRVYMWREL
ncbi:MAG: hypothetical protein BRC29_03605 [Nanohaloarchaea archaeon SW_7_43_1]|nr:MAG: hypothetical protein BRC29_03605 [Nanohaloarchaea archaeon SW_7_43_1]